MNGAIVSVVLTDVTVVRRMVEVSVLVVVVVVVVAKPGSVLSL